MDFVKGGERFVENEGHVVEEEVDEAHEEVDVHGGFGGEVAPIERVRPDAFDHLEDLEADVEFVVELGVGAGVFDLWK